MSSRSVLHLIHSPPSRLLLNPGTYDGIPAALLLNCHCVSELASSLLILFKQYLNSGVIDSSLKTSCGTLILEHLSTWGGGNSQ